MKKSKRQLSRKQPKPSKRSPSKETPFKVTAPRGSDLWKDEVWTRDMIAGIKEGLRLRDLDLQQKTTSPAKSKPAKSKPAKP